MPNPQVEVFEPVDLSGIVMYEAYRQFGHQHADTIVSLRTVMIV